MRMMMDELPLFFYDERDGKPDKSVVISSVLFSFR